MKSRELQQNINNKIAFFLQKHLISDKISRMDHEELCYLETLSISFLKNKDISNKS